MSRRRRDDRSRRGKVYNEHDADIVRELEEIEDAIEAGSAEMLMEVAQRLSRDQIFEIQESRWKKLLGFLGKGNQKLTQEQKIKKMRLVRERMKLEMDITKVLEFMYKEKSIRTIKIKELVPTLQCTYGINKKMVNFSANFPEVLTFYKMVAVVGDRYLSIYDGTTEYSLGLTVHQNINSKKWTKSGFFVYHTLQEVLLATYPLESALLKAPRAVLKVTTPAGGNMRVWDFQKVALEYMTPVEVVMKFGKTPRPPSAREKKLNHVEKLRQQQEYHQRYLNSIDTSQSKTKDDSDCSDSYALYMKKKKAESREGR